MTPGWTPAKRTSGGKVEGFTLLEMTIVVVMVVIMCGLLYQVTLRTMEASEYATAFNHLAISAQRVSNEMMEDLVTAKELFEDRTSIDTGRNRGVEYYNALDLSAKPPIDSTKLPVIEPNEVFSADTAALQKTGNCLMFIRTEPAYTVQVAYKQDLISGDFLMREVSIDLYRIVIYYLTKERGEIAGIPHLLDMVRWESIRFADKAQVEAVAIRDPTPADNVRMQSNLIEHLVSLPVHERVSYCWDASKLIDSAIFEFVSESVSGETVYKIADNPEAMPVTISPPPVPAGYVDVSKYRPYELLFDSAQRKVSVSWNTSTFATGSTFKSSVAVPKFGLNNLTGDWFPNGFEVQAVGQSGSRQILTRIVLAKETSFRHVAAHDATTIISTRDF